MAKEVTAIALTLRPRPEGLPVGRWLYDEIRGAILLAKLPRGTRLPSSRELATQYGLARGTVTVVFEQLVAEGYIESRTGSGTFIREKLPDDSVRSAKSRNRNGGSFPARDTLLPGASPQPPRVFRAYEPGVDAFPTEIWARLAGRRLRRATRSLFLSGDPRGYAPLREAVAAYLGASRGVRCSAGQVVIVSGTQQSLDLVARLLLRPHDCVWMEDPGYMAASVIFRAAGAKIVAVPVDKDGLDPAAGERLSKFAKAVYLTPAHQFPLGMTMPLQRRLALLEWAQRTGAYIVEDDYDSEFRYSERPIPALQGLDRFGKVIYMGSFNKVLFPSLRLGYLIVPEALLDPLIALRSLHDRFTATLPQAVLCDFMSEGHFGRHLRRMRQVYQTRLGALRESVDSYLSDFLVLPPIQAGLHIPAHLKPPLDAREIESAAALQNIEAMSLHRFVLERSGINALLLGFGAFTPDEIRKGATTLSRICLAQCEASSQKRSERTAS